MVGFEICNMTIHQIIISIELNVQLLQGNALREKNSWTDYGNKTQVLTFDPEVVSSGAVVTDWDDSVTMLEDL